MSIITGILKDKSGNELRPLTSASQVEVVEGGTRLDAWITTNETSLASVTSIIQDGKIVSSALPDIVNKFKGTFVNEAALPATGEAGDYAICTDTDTVWIWDDEKSGGAGWIDTGLKGSVTSVNSKTGDVVIEIADIAGLQTAIDAKVNTTDVVNNLTSGGTTVPLSAEQGVVLASMIASLESAGASTIDAVVIDNGAEVPSNLAEAGLYFEKDA